MKSLELKHPNPALNSKLRQARDLLKVGRIPGRFIPILLDKGVLSSLSKAHSVALEAPSPWEYVEPSEATGFQPQSLGTTRPRDLSDSERREGFERLEAASQDIDEALERIEVEIKRAPRDPLRLILVLIGLVVVFTAIIIVVWGVLRGSEIEIGGKDGVATLLLVTGVTLLSRLYFKDRTIRTLPDRIRTRLAVCKLSDEYTRVYECLMEVIQALDSGFQTISQHAAETVQPTGSA